MVVNTTTVLQSIYDSMCKNHHILYIYMCMGITVYIC